MKHKIDLATFERKHSVEFFRRFNSPLITLTSEVDCTGARERAKQHGISFFLYYTHALLRAVNEIKEFRYRMDEVGDIFFYDEINALLIIATGDNGQYDTLYSPYHKDLITFAQNAQESINNLHHRENPFGDELDMNNSGENNVILISAVPTLSFTSVNFAFQGNKENYPLTLIGKTLMREGKEYIPIAISVSHAFIDGFHLDLFYKKLAENLQT